jgi:hypothetical protein
MKSEELGTLYRVLKEKVKSVSIIYITKFLLLKTIKESLALIENLYKVCLYN